MQTTLVGYRTKPTLYRAVIFVTCRKQLGDMSSGLLRYLDWFFLHPNTNAGIVASRFSNDVSQFAQTFDCPLVEMFGAGCTIF